MFLPFIWHETSLLCGERSCSWKLPCLQVKVRRNCTPNRIRIAQKRLSLETFDRAWIESSDLVYERTTRADAKFCTHRESEQFDIIFIFILFSAVHIQFLHCMWWIEEIVAWARKYDENANGRLQRVENSENSFSLHLTPGSLSCSRFFSSVEISYFPIETITWKSGSHAEELHAS